MTLGLHELVQLSRISEALRKSDPELACTLSGFTGRWRGIGWRTAHVGVPAACSIMAVVGLVIGDVAISAIGGGVAMTVCPLVLVMARKRAPG
jgi:Protein of unknown function (DUF3040)